MSSDKEETEPRYYGIYDGNVAANNDPLGLGRVRLIVPGIIDQPGPWCFPCGTLGGGEPQRGHFHVPNVKADVSVWFLHGDPQEPRFGGGHWGNPAAGAEVPRIVAAAPVEDRPKIKAYETDKWEMFWDDRDGKEMFRVACKALSNLFIELDGAKGTFTISSEAGFEIKTLGVGKINAAQLEIVKRVVMKNGKPMS